MSQKRTPKGVPTGGEFAANTHDEAPAMDAVFDEASMSEVGLPPIPKPVATEEQAQRVSTAFSWGHQWMRKEAMQAATEIVQKQHDHPDASPDEITKLLVRDYEDRNETTFTPDGHRAQRRAVYAVLGKELTPFRPKRRSDAARGDEFVVLGLTPETGRQTVAVRRVTPTQITDHLGNRWSIATGYEIGGTRTLVPAEDEDGAPL